jgi:hypothetical protein
MAVKTTQIDGDMSLGRNIAMGGKATIAGSTQIGQDLVVKGWLDAPNIKAANKGVFTSLEALEAAYPEPQDGWFAGIGDSTPFTAYTGQNGSWVATGGTIDITTDMTRYTEDIEQLQQDSLDLSAHVTDHEVRISELSGELQGAEIINRTINIIDASTIASLSCNIAANTKFYIIASSEVSGKVSISFKLANNAFPPKVVTFNERLDLSFEYAVTNIYITKRNDTPASGSFTLLLYKLGTNDLKADKEEVDVSLEALSLAKADKTTVEVIGSQVDAMSGREIYNRTLTVGDSPSIANISAQITAGTKISMLVESENDGQLLMSFQLADGTYPAYIIPYNETRELSFEKNLVAIFVQKSSLTPQGDIRIAIRQLGDIDNLNSNVESLSQSISVYDIYNDDVEVEEGVTTDIYNGTLSFAYDTTVIISLDGYGSVFRRFEYKVGNTGYEYITSGRAVVKVKSGLTSLNVRIYQTSVIESGTIHARISANYLALNKANCKRLIGAIFYDGWKSAMYDNQAYGGSANSAISQDFYERSSVYDVNCPKWRDFIVQETGEAPVSQCSFSNYYPEEVAELQDGSGVNYPLLPSRKPMDAIEGVNMGWHNCDTQEQFDKQIEIAARYGLDYFSICVECADINFFATTDTIDESGIHRTVIEDENGNVTIDAVKFLDINKSLKFMLNTTRRDLKFCIYLLSRPTAGGNTAKAKERQIMLFEWLYKNVMNNINYLFVNSKPVLLAYLHDSYGMDSIVCGNPNHFGNMAIIGTALHRGCDGLCFYAVNPSKNGTYIASPYSSLQNNLNNKLSKLTEINNITVVPVMAGRGDMARVNFSSPGDWEQPTKAEFLNALKTSINVAEAINRDDKMVLIYAWNEFTEGGWLLPTQYEYEQGIAFKKLEAISEAQEYWSNL